MFGESPTQQPKFSHQATHPVHTLATFPPTVFLSCSMSVEIHLFLDDSGQLHVAQMVGMCPISPSPSH